MTNAELECGIANYIGKGVPKNEAKGFQMLRGAAETAIRWRRTGLLTPMPVGEGQRETQSRRRNGICCRARLA